VTRVAAVIPARYASTRFPGKVLAGATGRPLVQHVWERACAARLVDRVLIACDDRRIVEAVAGFGGEAVMTRADHENGTSRIAEIAPTLEADLVVNLQADEPEIEPAHIDRAIETLVDDETCCASTLAARFAPDEDPGDPNIVKVVWAVSGRALYFTRARVPVDRDGTGPAEPLKHVGLYVYRRSFLLRYPDLPPTPLEQTERLEQLRLLEHGERIAVAVVDARHHGIDTPEQYEAFVRRHGGTEAQRHEVAE
jgi:3-deoxy-manno-octulosonate cytidylyltransferase (CMP-KDO synthetase)